MKCYSIIIITMCSCLACRSSRTTQTDTTSFHTQQLHYSGEFYLNDTLLILPLATIFPDTSSPMADVATKTKSQVNCATGAVQPRAIIRHTRFQQRDTTTTTTTDTTTQITRITKDHPVGPTSWLTPYIIAIIGIVFSFYVVFVIKKTFKVKN